MGEILFKAKRIDNGEWVEGYYMFYDNDHIIITVNNNGLLYERVTPDTICQFTGLYDKDGNKIWENDVVEVWWIQRTLDKPIKPKKYKAVVEFGNPNGLYSWGWQLRFLEDFPFNNDILLWIDMEEAGAYCEVIGNIFDNPELMNATETIGQADNGGLMPAT